MTCIKIILPYKIAHKQLKMIHDASQLLNNEKKNMLSPVFNFIQVLTSKYYKLASQQWKVSFPVMGNLGLVCWLGFWFRFSDLQTAEFLLPLFMVNPLKPPSYVERFLLQQFLHGGRRTLQRACFPILSTSGSRGPVYNF